MTFTQEKQQIILVKDECMKPSPTECPPLLPTLQTYVGMVLHSGEPRKRALPSVDFSLSDPSLQSYLHEPINTQLNNSRVQQHNLHACSSSVSGTELINHIIHKKRLDLEQAVAMTISYIYTSFRESPEHTDVDDFEGNMLSDDTSSSAFHQLMADSSTKSMLTSTHMWREEKDHNLQLDPREQSHLAIKEKIQIILKLDPSTPISEDSFISAIQSQRRKRTKLNNSQYLTFPPGLTNPNIHEGIPSYRAGIQPQPPHTPDSIQLLSQRKFRAVYRLLPRLGPPIDTTRRYVHDVHQYLRMSSSTSPSRLSALKSSTDPFAIAYSFLSSQRHLQLKVVSDHSYSRFLIKGESALILQNRPDILTSLEDILVRHATDLKALTAIHCPKGIRDHFSERSDVENQATRMCEFMERYVKDFGDGEFENLVFTKESSGGSGRGPVDVYNRLCDELRECMQRAKAGGFELGIGPVYKFLAKDIMAWNNAWADDAFAGGKVPGWVGYLEKVRREKDQEWEMVMR